MAKQEDAGIAVVVYYRRHTEWFHINGDRLHSNTLAVILWMNATGAQLNEWESVDSVMQEVTTENNPCMCSDDGIKFYSEGQMAKYQCHHAWGSQLICM